MADVEALPDAEPEEPLEPLPELSLEIWNTIKSSHAEHGLRHGDYARYRAYCSRRLHRVRKSVGFMHGKGRYQKKPLDPQAAKENRHLMMPLYSAERAWSYAMALKRENSSQEARPRYHLLHRLGKAAKWSAALAKLCAARADKRTALEAEAYSGFMAGNLHLEREQWDEALAQFRKTRTICKELCGVSMSDQVHLYTLVAEEVEPSIRFCSYNLRRMGGDGGEAEEDEGAMEGLLDGESTEAVSDILRSKLEAVRDEGRARQAKDLEFLEVLDERVPIKSEKVRIAILRSQQQIGEIGAAAPTADPAARADMYDELFVAFNDALDGVRADLRAVGKEQSARSGAAEASLLKLQAGLTWQKLDHTVARTLLLVEKFTRTLVPDADADGTPAGGAAAASSTKRASTEDVVRLYDAIISSLADMAQLHGYREHEALMTQVGARQALAKAFRCFYLAESYGNNGGRWAEAQALYARATELHGAALSMLADAGYAEGSAEVGSLGGLESLIEGAKARSHAHAFLTQLTGGAAVAEADARVATLRLTKAEGSRPLIDSLDVFERPNVDNLVPFPPAFETVPCKPLLFDIARNHLDGPNLAARVAGPGTKGRLLSAGKSLSGYFFGK